MLNFIKNLYAPEKRFGTGALPDPVDERDFRHEEIVPRSDTFRIANWTEKPQEDWRKFPIFSQDGSGSCVGQTVAKLLGIENFVEEGKFVQFSARDIYSRGYQYESGMIYRDGMDIGYKFGSTIEQLMPSQNMGEDAMRKSGDRTTFTDQTALVGKGGNYFALPLNFDSIANVVLTGKSVALGTRFNTGQWNSGEVQTTANGQYGHATAVVDFTIWKGKKALVFDNSWGESWGFYGQGVITEDQLPGVNSAWYYGNLPNDWRNQTQPQPTKPKFEFTRDLKVGMNNNDVSMLQECLKYEQLFPSSIPSTGYFGGVTLDAVKKLQVKYGIDQTGYVGQQTRARLNELFSN